MSQALQEIRDFRLFLDDGFVNFETYVRERWSMSRSRAQQIIDVSVLREVAGIPVTSLKQARVIGPKLRKDPQGTRAQLARAIRDTGSTGAGVELLARRIHKGASAPPGNPTDLAKLLVSARMSQKELSERSGVPRETINHIHNGITKRVQFPVLLALTWVLEVPPEALAGLVDCWPLGPRSSGTTFASPEGLGLMRA
jgi:DNA-binding Xre family transcriptional regulator